MVHAVEFVNGSARYRNRFVRTEAYGLEASAGGPLWTGVMEDPAHNPQGNRRGLHFKIPPTPTSSSTTASCWRRGTCAAHRTPSSRRHSTPSEPRTSRAPRWRHDAHPKVDERTGELFWFDYGPSSPYMRYGVVGASGRVEHVVPIELAGPRLPHDMAITEHYAILMDLPSSRMKRLAVPVATSSPSTRRCRRVSA